MNAHFVLVLIAFICEALGAIGVPSSANLVAAGLACYFLQLLF